MVEKKNAIDKNKTAKNKDDKKKFFNYPYSSMSKDIIKTNSKINETDVKSVEKELRKNHEAISIETIKQIDSDSDRVKNKKDKLIRKIYPYWVYIFKDGKKIKDFGVREETVNGIKLLIRIEKTTNEKKVVFRELFPEPKYDLNVVDGNKNKIKKDLNLLKQIEKKLETEIYEEGKKKKYNYELSDVKLAILEKEILLDSIKYGKSYRYFHDIRDDGVKALFYEFESNGLKLKKEIKESSIFAHASEVKQIESIETKRDIDAQLSKKEDRDWC